MTRKYVAFDIETAKDVPGPEFNWHAHRPLGISCAAALLPDTQPPAIWYGKNLDGTPAEKMSQQEARQLVERLTEWVSDDYTIVTWNGLGFDFDVLAEESGAVEQCRELAMNHVDLMFHVLCDRGFPVALDKAALGLKIPGKPEGMSGLLAPRLWAEGRHQEVIDYVAEDVRMTLQIARSSEQKRSFKWMTRKDSVSSMALSHGWLTVKEALRLPEPDISWMTNPIRRRQVTRWMGDF